jgi:hypothetical protein
MLKILVKIPLKWLAYCLLKHRLKSNLVKVYYVDIEAEGAFTRFLQRSGAVVTQISKNVYEGQK